MGFYLNGIQGIDPPLRRSVQRVWGYLQPSVTRRCRLSGLICGGGVEVRTANKGVHPLIAFTQLLSPAPPQETSERADFTCCGSGAARSERGRRVRLQKQTAAKFQEL